MATTITYKVPTAIRATGETRLEERSGKVAWLKVGETRVKFVLQGGEGNTLVHFASGMVVGYLNPIKVEHMCRAGHNARMMSRKAAEVVIARAVARLGAQGLLAKLAAVPVINP
jgi:hypothetical protein